MNCAESGTSMVHIHARDRDGRPTYKKEIFGRIIEGIRIKRSDLILVVSTSGRMFNDFEQRSDVLNLKDDLKPDMASLTLGSVNFNKMPGINSPDTIVRLLEKMQEAGIKPELEVFDLGMINYAHYLIKKGLITKPYYFNIILGNIASAQAKLLHLGLIVSELPDESFWSVAGIGNCKKNINVTGIIFGDGVRVGIEDNLWYDDARTVLATNITLVEQIVKIARVMEREIANPADVRKMLGLP